jgi:2-polyprenyl-6-methoxyphenol hydroxylase-like FAD-dependent oxidoreductase
MAQPNQTDILICGAGAAGLTLAVDLARRGVACRLIEKAPGPFPGSRGKGLQPRSLEVFEDLGVLDRLLETARPYPPQWVYRADGGVDVETLTEAREPTPDEPYAMPLLSPQVLTERALRERLEALGGRVDFGHELQRFEQDANGVTATVAGPNGAREIRCRYLVGVDGGRSQVRRLLGVDFPGQTLGVRAIVADVKIEGLDDKAWRRWGEGLGMIGLCPLWGTDLFQLQAPIVGEGEADLSAPALNAMVAQRTGRADLKVASVAWASAYSMNARLADRYRVGRVFLAGDAAHIHPPTGGQGLNTSLQDAYNLGWKLAAVLDGAPDALLDSYEAERRPVAAEVLGLSARLLEDARAKIAMRRGRETSQLDIGYPDSPLSLAGPERGVAAGDRAPDAPVAAGRLFDHFRGPHWTLLGLAGGPAPSARAEVKVCTVEDDGGHMRAAYGLMPSEWVLVRPDGYVAGLGEAPALLAHLDRILG